MAGESKTFAETKTPKASVATGERLLVNHTVCHQSFSWRFEDLFTIFSCASLWCVDEGATSPLTATVFVDRMVSIGHEVLLLSLVIFRSFPPVMCCLPAALFVALVDTVDGQVGNFFGITNTLVEFWWQVASWDGWVRGSLKIIPKSAYSILAI